MLLGLVSDVHATPAPLAEALALFAARGVDAVLCAGDIAGYGDELDATVDLLRAHGCHTIAGNHDRWLLADPARSAGEASRAWLAGLPTRLVHDSERMHLLMVHASPPESLMDGIRLLDEQGLVDPAARSAWERRLAGCSADVLVVGHTHQVFAERLGATLVVNPGSTCFNHSCALLELPAARVEFLPLSGRAIEPTWNWSGGWGSR